jgi:hypothetical protein
VICYIKSISAEVWRVVSLFEPRDCAKQVCYAFVVAEACLNTRPCCCIVMIGPFSCEYVVYTVQMLRTLD